MSLAMIVAPPTLLIAADDASEKKSDAKKVDPSGTWRWQYDWQNAEVKEAFRLSVDKKGNVVGKLYRNESTVLDVKDGNVKGNEVSFKVTTSYEGSDYVTTYQGKIDGDNFDGTVALDANGESYEWPFAPKRSVQMEDLVGTWQFVIEAQGNVFEPKLIVSKDGDKHKAAYNSPMLGKDDQPEVEKFRIEKNELMFTINVSFNGNDMKLDYKGRTYGDKIKGSIDVNSGTAELEFEGKRESKKK